MASISKVVSGQANSNLTLDTFQRKVFYHGGYYYVIFWSANDSTLKYSSSLDGINWNTPTTLLTFGTAVPKLGGFGDLAYPRHEQLSLGNQTFDVSIVIHRNNLLYIRWWNAINGSLVSMTGTIATSLSGTNAYGLHKFAALKGTWTDTWARAYQTFCETGIFAAIKGQSSLTISSTTGGNQVLAYETQGNYYMLLISKDANNVLYSKRITPGGGLIGDSWTTIATLSSGFSSFCACTEAQETGAPQRIHLAYIKLTGELCYKKFENLTWGEEVTIESSGATYPVLATDTNGSVYLFYVKDGEIKKRIKTGANWPDSITLISGHTFNSPIYLSTNQYVQNGKICLVWTETGTSYEVWFYQQDQESVGTLFEIQLSELLGLQILQRRTGCGLTIGVKGKAFIHLQRFGARIKRRGQQENG